MASPDLAVPVRSLCGLASAPVDRTALSAWLRRHQVPMFKRALKGGEAEFARLSDLPAELQLALRAREAGASGGAVDGAAWAAFVALPRNAQAAGRRKAALFTEAQAMCDRGASLAAVVAELRARHGDEAPSVGTLHGWEAKLVGIDPANWAPALADRRGGNPKTVAIDQRAWDLFVILRDKARHTWPMKQAWRDTRNEAARQGWAWPSYRSIARRWDALAELDKARVLHGAKGGAALMTARTLDRSGLIAMGEWVMDGRTADVWVRFPGDTKATRPIVLAVEDYYSKKLLGFRVCKKEIAADTHAMLIEAIKKYGIPDGLKADNSRAFNGHIIAGQTPHKFRGKRIEIL